jgi:NAD+--asparagine ADP-ribosyltransferase
LILSFFEESIDDIKNKIRSIEESSGINIRRTHEKNGEGIIIPKPKDYSKQNIDDSFYFDRKAGTKSKNKNKAALAPIVKLNNYVPISQKKFKVLEKNQTVKDFTIEISKKLKSSKQILKNNKDFTLDEMFSYCFTKLKEDFAKDHDDVEPQNVKRKKLN